MILKAAKINSPVGWRIGEIIVGLITLVLITVSLTASPAANAEFYVRKDDLGRSHISNLPPRSFANNGKIRRAYDPNSIVYQHARMREALAEQSAALVHARDEERLNSIDRGYLPSAPPPRRAPREGTMNLNELIELEKRGGRWQGTEEDQH